MSYPTYSSCMAQALKPLVWLEGEIKTPPFSKEARVEAGTLLLRIRAANPLGCRIRGRCPVLANAAMNCAFAMRPAIGGSSIDSNPIAF